MYRVRSVIYVGDSDLVFIWSRYTAIIVLSLSVLHFLFFVLWTVADSKFCDLQNRLNITKTVRKYSIDSNLNPTGSEFHPGPIPKVMNHGDEHEEEYGEGSVSLTASNFDKYTHK